MLIDDAKERAKLLVQSAKIFQKYESHRNIESYRQDTAAVCRDTKPGLSVLSISDFPSVNYAKLYLTKRKSVKNASDSSLKLISYSSIFASVF